MPATISIDDFLELVRKCGAVDSRKLDAFVGPLRKAGTLPDDPADLAEMLIEAGLMTRFQAEPLIQGKQRRFLISGKYKLLDRIGAGGMASVYLCEHRIMRRRVAIKILPPSMAKNPSSLERFHREARASAALDHPNIVRAHDVDNDGNMHFLVVEYIDGVNLSDLVRNNAPLAIDRACHYIAQTCAGLQSAHVVGLVHRDIKPANLLLDRYGTVKILDLGLALFFHDDDELTKEHDNNAVLGTADYLAPEQGIDSHGVDIRADIYSLGATLYFLLTGQPPFAGGTIAQKLVWHHMRAVKPASELRPEVPPELDAVIEKMMAKDRDLRYQTPREVFEALQPWTRNPIAPPAEHEMPKALSPLLIDPSMPDMSLSMPSVAAMPAAIDESDLRPSKGKTDVTARMPTTKAGPKSNAPVGSASGNTMTGQADRTPGPVKNPGKGKSQADEAGEEASAVKKNRKAKKAVEEAKKKQQTVVLAFGFAAVASVAVGLIVWGLISGDETTVPTYISAVNNAPPPAPVIKVQPPTPPPIKKVDPPKVDPPKVDPPKVEPMPMPPKVEPMPPAKVEPPAPAPTVTADFFFPMGKPDLEMQYDVATHTPGGVKLEKWKYDFGEGDKVDVILIQVGILEGGPLLGNGTTKWGAAGKQLKGKFAFRVEDGFVQLGSPERGKKDSYTWEKVLKLDAKAGDSWQVPAPVGDPRTITIDRFDKHKNRDAVVVKEVLPTPAGDVVTSHTFVRGVGEVTRSQTAFPKAAAPPANNVPAVPGGAPATGAANPTDPKLLFEMKLVE